MKRLLLLLALLLTGTLFAQNSYTIDGQTYELSREVDGPMSLLLGVVDGQYRYFIEKDGQLVELTNTKEGKKYQDEYKQTLSELSSDHPIDTSDVKLTKGSLRKFCNVYNGLADPNYQAEENDIKIKTRLGIWGGMTNYPYFINPGNDLNGQVGIDFEMVDYVKLRRHSLVVQLRQIFSSSNWDVSSFQASLNYRFKYVQTDALDLFINLKVVDYVSISPNIMDPNGDGDISDRIEGSEGGMQVPFAFGLGGDIAMANGYITLAWYDLLALGIDDNGEFPVDFAIGYKFRL